MAAVLDAITGLATTGSRVQRGRVYNIEEVPALTLYQGADTPLDADDGQRVISVVDNELLVRVDAHVKTVSTQIDTQLNLIRKEVYAALAPHNVLGLSFVRQVIWRGADEPELSGEGDQPAARMTMNFGIRYRHSATDASA
jgi:hypothetical protein